MSAARPRVWRPIVQKTEHVWRLFVGDEVQVVKSGPDKDGKGKVIAILRDTKKPEVIVEGLNMRKKRIYTGLKEDEFSVVSMEHPMDYSDVLLLDPVSQKPVETVFQYLKSDGRRVRVPVGPNASDRIILIPEPPDKVTKAGMTGPKDTSEEEARRVTYDPMGTTFPFQTQREGGRSTLKTFKLQNRQWGSLFLKPGTLQTTENSRAFASFSLRLH